MTELFTPPFYLRSAFVQTLLASRIPNRRNNPMLATAREVILTPVADIRLQGFYSPQTKGAAKGVVILLHGWEGSVNSSYMLRTGRFLYEHDLAVFRLNYRDHGETHHLNRGLFYAILLDEVFGAIQQIATEAGDLPVYLAGFSMGGNFALRIARKHAETPIQNLKHIFSISPVLDPEKSTRAIDAYPLLRNYFREKWSRSLLKKQALYPELYDFDDVLNLKTISEMTEVMVKRFSQYQSSTDYFRQYAVLGDALLGLTVPVTIVTAQDDPIIPSEDFYELKLPASTELMVQRYGGHNGFLETLSGKAWYQQQIIDRWIKTS